MISDDTFWLALGLFVAVLYIIYRTQHFQEKGGIALNLAPGCELQELLSEDQGESQLFQNTLSCVKRFARTCPQADMLLNAG